MIVPIDGNSMTIPSTATTPPPQTLPPTIHSHPFPLITKLIENSIMTQPQNSYLISNKAKTATDDATDATESIVFDDKPDRKSDDDDDSNFYLNKGPSPPNITTTLPSTASTSPSFPFPTLPHFIAALVEKQYSDFTLRKFPKYIYTTTTTADNS